MPRGVFPSSLSTVNNARTLHNLALVGFMGTGKSTIGRIAAEQMQFTFVDTDALIESRLGRTISDVFEREGEATFRQYEKSVVRELAGEQRLVIATGGGLVMDPANMASLKGHALVIWLCATPDAIWERVRSQTHRPLLQTPDPLAKIREMLTARMPSYREADIYIDSGLRTPREVAAQLAHQFHLARKR